MITIHLAGNSNQWLIKYEEASQRIAIEGPDPESQRIYRWLTTPKHVIDRKTGSLISVIPTHSWTYMEQVLDIDLYNDLRIGVVWEKGEY